MENQSNKQTKHADSVESVITISACSVEDYWIFKSQVRGFLWFIKSRKLEEVEIDVDVWVIICGFIYSLNYLATL